VDRTKSSLMLGVGETADEVRRTLSNLRDVDVDYVTLGQYLRPSDEHVAVERWVPPEEFESHRETALDLGFRDVAAGPFVRSSYRADELYDA
ncbi:MAG: lipoyl synthase, partial [Halobacteriales archaeon]